MKKILIFIMIVLIFTGCGNKELEQQKIIEMQDQGTELNKSSTIEERNKEALSLQEKLKYSDVITDLSIEKNENGYTLNGKIMDYIVINEETLRNSFTDISNGAVYSIIKTEPEIVDNPLIADTREPNEWNFDDFPTHLMIRNVSGTWGVYTSEDVNVFNFIKEEYELENGQKVYAYIRRQNADFGMVSLDKENDNEYYLGIEVAGGGVPYLYVEKDYKLDLIGTDKAIIEVGNEYEGIVQHKETTIEKFAEIAGKDAISNSTEILDFMSDSIKTNRYKINYNTSWFYSNVAIVDGCVYIQIINGGR